MSSYCIHGRFLDEPCVQCGFTKQVAPVASEEAYGIEHDALTCPICMPALPEIVLRDNGLIETETSRFDADPA